MCMAVSAETSGLETGGQNLRIWTMEGGGWTVNTLRSNSNRLSLNMHQLLKHGG